MQAAEGLHLDNLASHAELGTFSACLILLHLIVGSSVDLCRLRLRHFRRFKHCEECA